MTIKLLRMRLRKMKGKGHVGDPYLADFTQRIMDNRRGNQEIINAERQEGQEVLVTMTTWTL